MPNFTRNAIKDSFLKLLSQRPLDKITVKDIVEDCGVNRNSFYYHFEDLPALLEEIVAELVSSMIERHPTIDSVEEGCGAIVEFVTQNRRAIYHIYNSLSRDVFERHLMKLCQYVVSAYAETVPAGLLSDEVDKAVVVRFHRCALFGTVIDWLNEGMHYDIAAYFHRISRLRLGWPENSDAGASCV
ncbi:MAG: TetR/AcrR family transcriptional regulator [Oscillospiraceae bacterium]|nr:TetR/AcrR family transcriptional regulator [Oscillospiraceae bacterium]